jgi:3-hydroxyisobutyrate dehydrogenase-like beta-hydroxyacid dehydrogenase
MKEEKSRGTSIGFIGLGSMGLPIARNLLNAGYPLRVFNRTGEKALPLVELGAELVDSPDKVADMGGVAFSMLADDDAVRAISLKNTDFLRNLGPEGIHVSMSTHFSRNSATADRRTFETWRDLSWLNGCGTPRSGSCR